SVILDMGAVGAPAAPAGRFFFRFRFGDVSVAVQLLSDLVSDDFNQLVRKELKTTEEEALLVDMKEDLAARIMSLPAELVYEISGRQ
ncbi:MAG: hypothetical protein ACRDRT_02050, partial [Pseudonocardiaceae bacterium]